MGYYRSESPFGRRSGAGADRPESMNTKQRDPLHRKKGSFFHSLVGPKGLPALVLFLILISVGFTVMLYQRKQETIHDFYLDQSETMRNLARTVMGTRADSYMLLAYALASREGTHNGLLMKNSSTLGHVVNSFAEVYHSETEPVSSIWIQFLTPDFVSLYRSWTTKTGDSLRNVRSDLRRMEKDPHPQKTLSVGIFTISFKNTVPIVENGKLIGFVEVIVPLQSAVNGLYREHGVRMIILIDGKYRSQLVKPVSKIFLNDWNITAFVDPEDASILKTHPVETIPLDENYLLAGGQMLTSLELKGPEGESLGRAVLLQSERQFEESLKDSLAFLTFWLYGFAGLSVLLILMFFYYIRRLQQGIQTVSDQNLILENRVQEELKKSRQRDQFMFQQARNLSLLELLVNLSHHWRQPLGNAGVLIQRIQDEFEAGELTKESMDTLVGESLGQLQELSRTIDRFSEFYNATGHRENEEQFQRFSPLHSCRQAWNLLGQAGHTGLEVRFECDLPEDFHLMGSENEMTRILVSLISNCINAARNRSHEILLIRVHLEKRDDELAILVEDDAGGISPEVLPRIFDPYFTTSFRSRGVGMGLFVVRNQVEGMGGTIRAENTEIGARMILHFPRELEG